MPTWLTNIFSRSFEKEQIQPNRYEGFNDNGVILRDRRGTLKQEMPEVTEKGIAFGSDPLAIYRPTNTKDVNASRAMANFSGWVFASVNAIASEVANIQIRLYKLSEDEHQEVVDHPLLTLLEGVNETMTGIELKYTTMAHLELAGNAYWLLDGVKSDTDQPRAIYPLNPGSMHVRLNKSSFPYRISHYEYHVDGNIIRFETYQMLHLKYPDPNDPFVGIGVPQTIPSWIDSDNYAMEYNRKFFQNGASIGLFIQTDTNVEGNIDRIRKGFDNRYAGVDNAHKVPVLPKGVKLEHSGVTQRDMDFSVLTEATRDRILAGFRVSKTILGTAESDTNRSTAETADYVFSKRTIKPKMLLIISYLNEFLAALWRRSVSHIDDTTAIGKRLNELTSKQVAVKTATPPPRRLPVCLRCDDTGWMKDGRNWRTCSACSDRCRILPANSQTAPPSAYQVPPMQPIGAKPSPLIVGWAGRQEGARFLDTVCL